MRENNFFSNFYLRQIKTNLDLPPSKLVIKSKIPPAIETLRKTADVLANWNQRSFTYNRFSNKTVVKDIT